MANKISLIFEAIGADKLAQAFGQVQSGAEKAGASAEKAGQGAAKAGQSAGDAAKHVDVLGLSLNKMSGLAGQAGVDLSVFQRAAQGAHESMSLLAGGFSAGTVAAGTFVTGIAAMTGVLVAASQHLVSSYNEIKTFAAVSGMAAGDADDLADAMGAVGVSSQQLSMALFKLEDDAAGGGEALLKLGLTMDDLRTKSAGDLFVATIDKIQALGSQSEKTAALVEIFGARLGRAFAELVREGGMSIDQLKEKVADLSPWTKEMETNARNLAVAQEFLRNAIGGVVDMLGNAFAPILTSAITAMTEWVVSLRKGVEESGVLGTTINMLVDVFAALWEALSPLMPLLKELGLAAVQVGLAMLAAFQGVMIPVVALTGAIGALWAAIQKAASGDFAGALTALKTGLAETEAAVGRQIERFNEQVRANEKLSDSLSGLSTSWDDLGSYTTEAGVAVDKVAPSLRTVGDEAKKTADALKAWERAVGQVGITAAFIYDDVRRLQSAMEFEELEAGVQALEAWEKALGQVGVTAAVITDDVEKLRSSMEFDELEAGVRALDAWEKALGQVGTTAAFILDDVEKLRSAMEFDELEAGIQALAAWEKAIGQVGVTAAFILDDVEKLRSAMQFEGIEEGARALDAWEKSVGQVGLTAALVADDVEKLRGEMEFEELEKGIRQWEDFRKSIKDVFLSVTDTFTKMATGLIQGTTTIGDAFKNLGQSLLANFTQIVMHKVFDPILEKAADFVVDFIDTIVGGISSFDWAGFFNSVMRFIGGGGGGGGGFNAGDWWDDIGFDMYAHGGLVRRTGPAVLHAGETVVPAGYGSGWQSSGFSGGGGGGYGGTVPVRVENVDAFGQQFGTWAGRVIGAAPLAFQAAGWMTGSSALSGIGSGLGIKGALTTGFNMATNAPNIPGGFGPASWFGNGPAFDPTSMTNMYAPGSVGPFNTGWSLGNVGSLASGFGSILSLAGGLTGTPALGYAGMGIQGAVLATQIASALIPSVGTAVGTGLTAIGSGISAIAPGLVSAVAPAMAAIGPIMAAAGPLMAPFAVGGLVSMLTAKNPDIALSSITRRAYGEHLGGEMQTRQEGVLGPADLSRPDIRADLALMGAAIQATIAPAYDSMNNLIAMQERGEGNFQDLIDMERRNITKSEDFMAGLATLGITPDVNRLEREAPYKGAQGGPLGFFGLDDVDFWNAIFSRMGEGITTSGEAATETTRVMSDAATAQSQLLLKYKGQADTLRTISDALDLDIVVPKLADLPQEAIDFLATATEEQLKAIVSGWKTAVTDAIVADPIKLLPLLDLTKLKQFDETAEETAERVGTALLVLGDMMNSLELEALALTDPLGAATRGFQQTIDAVNSADWDDMAENMRNADPTDWAEAAVTAHDLLIARYEALLALEQAINQSTGALYSAGIAVTQMGPLLHTMGVSIGPIVEGLTSFAGTLPTATTSLTAFGGAVEAFGNLALLAGQTADPALIQSAITSFGNLMNTVPTVMAQIMAIEDPTARMNALVQFMGQLGTAAQAAVAGVSALIDHINQLVVGVAAAAGALTTHAPIFAKAGVDLGTAATNMANFVTQVPTAQGSILALGGAANLGMAAMGQGQLIDPAAFANAAITTVEKIMTLSDPGQRVSALSTIMDNIAKVLNALPPDVRDAIIKSFGPGLKFIGDAIIDAGEQAAARAIAVGEQLKTIIGGTALNPENFLLMMVKGMNEGIGAIVTGVGPAFDLIIGALTGAGTDIAGSITTAGIALSGALGTFSTAADQLKFALDKLDTEIGDAVKAGVSQALTDHGLQTGSGVAGVGHTGLYVLHEGERVLNRGENIDYQTGRQGAGVTVTLSFGDIHLARGGRQEAEEFIATVEASIKHGRLRDAVQRAAVGQA